MFDYIIQFVPNVAIAAIGGSITVITKYIFKIYKRKNLEKKHPIRGEYISEYEDTVEGKKIIIKAPMQVHQKGKNVFGKTNFDHREWFLEGEITDDNYLYGRYYAKTVRDKGFGNFFFKIEINGDMNGLWSGYDSKNRNIQSGNYRLKKKVVTEITHITNEKEIHAALSIAEQQLGQSYISGRDFIDKNNISLLATANKIVVGFSIGKIKTIGQLYKDIPQLKGNNIRHLEIVKNVGLISAIATDEKYKVRGVASTILKRTMHELENKGVNILIMIAWVSSAGMQIGTIAKSFGFREILKIENFWEKDSIKHHYTCPTCGKPPCTCTAVIFLKHNI